MTGAAKDFATMQAFIAGRLSASERHEFEDRLAREPDLVSELEQSLRMREGLRTLHSEGYFKDAASQRKTPRTWVPAFALAASAVLGVFLWMSRGVSPAPGLLSSLPPSSTDATPGIAAQFSFITLRGASTPELDLPSSGTVDFRAAASRASTHYQLSLQRLREGAPPLPVGSLNGLTVGADGYVHAYADASRLSSGRYELRIRPEGSDPSADDVSDFDLRSRNPS